VDIDTISNLYYNQKLGIVEIAHRLNLKYWQVQRLMKKNNLPRRKASETNAFRFLRTETSFRKKHPLTTTETQLFISGLMLYWAEGCKPKNKVVDLSNSNPKIVYLFLKMLRDIYNIKEDRLRALLYCYSNQNPEELTDK